MHRSIERLIRMLERLHTMYDELLACAQEKTELLVSNDTEGLENLQGRRGLPGQSLRLRARVPRARQSAGDDI